MYQSVTLIQHADRHSHLTTADREFAQCFEVVVTSGKLKDILIQASELLPDVEVGRYTLVIGEPYD